MKDALMGTATTQYVPIAYGQIPEAQRGLLQCVPTVPSTAKEDTTDTLFLVPFKGMEKSFYSLWKIGI